jgi:uncharacterized protein YdaU (DUF1376 family)
LTDPTLPAPLVPADVDLTDFGFMPLEVRKLLSSSLWIKAKKDPRLGHAAMSLWCEAWHQVPCASLPDDDEVLAELARCDEKEWKRVRERVLANFVKCSDGRLYHETVAKKAMESWTAKVAQRERTKAATKAREAKHRARDEQRDVPRNDERDEQRDVPRNDERDEQRDVPRNDERDEQRDEQRDVARDEDRDVHQGTVKGQGELKEIQGARPDATTLRALAEGTAEPEDPAIGAGTRYGLAAKAMRQRGCAATPGDPRLRQLVDQGASLEEFEAVGAEAADKGKGPAWALTALINRRKDAAEVQLAPAAAAPAWHETRAGVSQRGQELNLGAWSDVENESIRRGVIPSFAAYRVQVIAADKAAGGTT